MKVPRGGRLKTKRKSKILARTPTRPFRSASWTRQAAGTSTIRTPPARESEYSRSQTSSLTAWCLTARKSILSARLSRLPPITTMSTRTTTSKRGRRRREARPTKACSTPSRSESSFPQVKEITRDRLHSGNQLTCSPTHHFLAHVVYRHFLSP